MSVPVPPSPPHRRIGIAAHWWRALKLRGLVNLLEDGIITLSGPALALSGIIAGVDLITGGHLFQTLGWLSLTWAICLMLSLDFQVLVLGFKGKAIYLAQNKGRWQKAGELLLVIVVAAAISFVSVQMQSIIARSSSANTSVDQAARDLGIDAVMLIWERSVLVLFLIFLSGWSRDRARQQGQDQQVSHLADPQALLDAVRDQVKQSQQECVARLAQTNQEQLAHALEQFTQTHQETLARSIEHLEQAHARWMEGVLTRMEQVRVIPADETSFPESTLSLTDGLEQDLPLLEGSREKLREGHSSRDLINAQQVKRTYAHKSQRSDTQDPDKERNEGHEGEGIRGQVQAFIAHHLATTGALPGVKRVTDATGCARNTARKYLRAVSTDEPPHDRSS